MVFKSDRQRKKVMAIIGQNNSGAVNVSRNATKTFKIGEYARGGVITAKATKTTVTVIGKEWDFSTGSSRGSDQSGAEEFTRLTVNVTDPDAERKVSDFLNDLTTSYYSDQVLDWVKSKTEFKSDGQSGRYMSW